MATKVLLNRMSPLAEKSLNKPHHHHGGYHLLRLSSSSTDSSRKRSASNAFAAATTTAFQDAASATKKHRIIVSTPPMNQQQQKKKILTTTLKNNTNSKATKSVRFNLQEQPQQTSSIHHHHHERPSSSLCWYSADELQQIRKREAQVVRNLQQHQTNNRYLRQLTCLLGVACGAYDQSTTSSTNIESIQYVVANCDEARGLEKELLGCIRQRRRQVVQTLLGNQLMLQQRGGSYNKPEFRTKVLSLQYIKLSTPSQQLAQLMGQGDAMVVVQQQQSC